MRLLLCAVALAITLAGCDNAPPAPEPTSGASAVAAKPKATFQAISGKDIFAMIFPADMTADDLAAAAREQCGQREFCQVHGWLSEADAAKAFPMTDREVSKLAFQYAHNRTTGFERRAWDCKRWPRTDPDECIATE